VKHSPFALTIAAAAAFVAVQIGCSGSGGGGSGTGGSSGTSGGSGGTTATGGTGTGGASTGGAVGTGGVSTGGTVGTGGASTGGTVGTGGTAGAGTTGTGGAAGGGGGVAGHAGAGGRGGRGGAAGSKGGRGGSGGSAGHEGAGGGGSGGASATLTLTSTAFAEGMMIPTAQTCTGSSHVSPPLSWTTGPGATASYGVALVDMTNGYIHWTIWDLPAATTALPGNLPKTQTLTTPVMAQQVNAFSGDGYYGPCPMGATHTYVFEVYALDVAKLPSVSATSMPADVRTQMMMHALAKGTLSGTSNASM
jgi:Raf kinase inhibitor-like YbhB/YbcL family protein